MWVLHRAEAPSEGTFLPHSADQEVTRMNPTHVHKHKLTATPETRRNGGEVVSNSPAHKDVCPWLKLKRNETNK